MIHVLNNLASDCELQMYLLEKRRPIEVDELHEELNLRFETLSIQSELNS